MSAVLEALEQRAGASDTDRQAWLAERKQGVTATEIRDLYLGKITIDRLVALKLGREVDSFSGNAYTAWGNEREPVIARVIEQRFPGIRPESRVFRGENPRHLASPDGIGLYGFDEELVVSEIKTAGKSVAPWTDAYAEKGYEYQQQWVMHVTGATRCLFAWEIREEGQHTGRFWPGRLQFEWVHRNEAIIADLVKLADEFLAALDEAAAQPWEGPAPIDEVLDTHAVNYLRAKDEANRWAELQQEHYRAALAMEKSQTSALAKVTFTPAKPGAVVEVEEIDFDAARATPEGAVLFAGLQMAQGKWDEHCKSFTRTREVVGKGSPAKATITAVRPDKEKGKGDARNEE